MDQYQYPCGCYVLMDGNETTTKRCDEHKAKYPHRLDRAQALKPARSEEK